ncbi:MULTISPECIES: RagB/SusD family nutrient uptake outer membrane protein [Sphingobacterium]|uniref:RagB/SusD family nutrient uptake outer membrane protein n=1 Tax=Sphingobacterium TaxID=28453 RepID=UPI00191A86AE|nr:MULTISPECIES: RagB/SusD family nutrient uptake outer membrane protein [Sphingobacterium]QQT27126.1 RagB/SusD family nutrient uptake outer membrane protein [Sphingobacterium spiritivorum]
MKKRKLYILTVLGILAINTSCEKFLDPLPDNRAELNSTEKISKMLVSAYPQTAYVVPAEWASDNTDEQENLSAYSDRFSNEIYNWQPSTEVGNNDGIDRLWSSSYSSIASANAALQAIEEAGSPASLNAQKGEALVARAYNHFILVNMFAQHYAKDFSSSDLGVTYMTKGETILNPKYERNTVQEVYDFIIKDLEEGIPLISDNSYANSNVAKYHFNKAAANTFAARVYLYMGNWEKAQQYASLALGVNPADLTRNYAYIASFGTTWGNVAREFNASSDKANLLIAAPVSAMGVEFGPYGGPSSQARYSHGWLIGNTEGPFARPPYNSVGLSDTQYRIRTFRYSSATLYRFLFPRVTYMFEVTDPIAATGFWRGVFTPITSEEALLTRAEANIHLKKYSEALVDMQLWAKNTITPTYTMTEATINTWANSFNYYTPTAPTPKKKFNNPDYVIDPGTQENMLHAVLFMRRVQTLHTGLRWFDVKRYGIEINRRVVNGLNIISAPDLLKVRDNRRAFQLPVDVIEAGLTPNPR